MNCFISPDRNTETLIVIFQYKQDFPVLLHLIPWTSSLKQSIIVYNSWRPKSSFPEKLPSFQASNTFLWLLWRCIMWSGETAFMKKQLKTLRREFKAKALTAPAWWLSQQSVCLNTSHTVLVCWINPTQFLHNRHALKYDTPSWLKNTWTESDRYCKKNNITEMSKKKRLHFRAQNQI